MNNKRRWVMDRSDVLVGLGVVLIGLGLSFLVGWAGVLAWYYADRNWGG